MVTARIIASLAHHNELKTVNVVTEAVPKGVPRAAATQALGPVGANVQPTYQLAATGTKGVPSIYIPGFTGPA
jgi:hypothetical protein